MYYIHIKHTELNVIRIKVVMGLISLNDESVYRREVGNLVDCCRANNLCTNAGKMKEMVVNFRRSGHTSFLYRRSGCGNGFQHKVLRASHF